jgi:hypothetical protein
MRQRLSIVCKGFVYGVCVAALLPFASAVAQGPNVAMQPPPAPVVTAPATTAAPPPAAPTAIKPVVTPSMEEREDPFSPSLTDAERRAEDDRRVRELVQPMINQMRDAISQGMGAQIEQSMQKSLETMKRPDGSVPGAGLGGPVKGGDHSSSSADQQKEEEAEARAQEQYAKAMALAEDPNPAKRSLGRALLEQYGRGIMPRWSSANGVYFIGCVNKKRMYRDKFGDVFSSEFWFDGSAGAGNSTGGTGVTQTTAARQPQQLQQRVASGASSGQGPALALDPCAD